MAGYSQTTLAKKLGIKEGAIIRLHNAPDYYFNLFTDFPEQVEISNEGTQKKDLIHVFLDQAELLYQLLPLLKREIRPNGAIWISWPKKASKVPTDITEDLIRQVALQYQLVDVKVCAVDNIWSGLKLVIPLKNRKK